MQFQLAMPALLAAIFLGSIASATPIPCPDVSARLHALHNYPQPHRLRTDIILQSKRDQILMGTLEPEACCPYGICKGDVVVQGG